jgi:hypothetical protein
MMESTQNFDLFTQPMRGRIAVHLNTETAIIILDAQWIKGQVHYNVLVPVREDGKETQFCNATYSDSEIVLTDDHIKNYEKNKITTPENSAKRKRDAIVTTAKRSATRAERRYLQQ